MHPILLVDIPQTSVIVHLIVRLLVQPQEVHRETVLQELFLPQVLLQLPNYVVGQIINV
jgi:hypothetical protein